MSWWKPKPVLWVRLEGEITDVESLVRRALHILNTAAIGAVERHAELMATVQDLRNSLQGLGDAIAQELEQLKQVLQQQGGVPQEVIDQVDATTAKVSNLVEDAMPAPEPPTGRR